MFFLSFSKFLDFSKLFKIFRLFIALGTRFKILVFDRKKKNIFGKIQKKLPFSTKNWSKSLIKVSKFVSTIHTYSKIEKSTIRNRIHYIKFILVLVIWKHPLTRVFPLFVIKLYRESTVHKKLILFTYTWSEYLVA